MEESNKKNKTFTIIILATVFGLLAGVAGEIIARAWLLGKEFNIPLFGEINYQGEGANGSNLVISNPRKVVVEQNIKVAETFANARHSLVGIYENQKPGSDTKEDFDINDYWQLKESVGQGYILTSDGWIISSFLPPKLKSASKELTPVVLASLVEDYMIINHENKVFKIDNILYDQNSGYSYWHINAIDLPVKRFVPDNDIENGQIVLAVNWQESSWLTNIAKQSEGQASGVLSSDVYINEIVFTDNPSEDFYGSFVFNLNSEIIALINSQGEAQSIASFLSCINCLLNNKNISAPSLGINYLDLSTLLNKETNELGKGVMVTKNLRGVAVEKESAAELVEIEEGDIILSINNIELNDKNHLNQIISTYIPGDEIQINFIREEKPMSVKAVLTEK